MEESSCNAINVSTKKSDRKSKSDDDCSITEKHKTAKDNKNIDTSSKTDFINKFIKSSNISPLDFIILPNVEVFSNDSSGNSNEEYHADKNYPQLIDLCYEDKLRIGRLIEEVAKCKERNIEDTKIIADMQKDKFNMTIEINKLDKEITKFMADCKQKDIEIMQINKQHSMAIEDHKMQIRELKLKLDVEEKQWSDKWEELQKKNKELMIMIHKLNDNNKDLMFKYRNKKKKLQKALTLIKVMIRVSNDDDVGGKADKACQIPSKTRININSKTANEDIINLDAAVHDQNTTDLQILSELFFKVASDGNYEAKDPFVLLMQDNILHNKNI